MYLPADQDCQVQIDNEGGPTPHDCPNPICLGASTTMITRLIANEYEFVLVDRVKSAGIKLLNKRRVPACSVSRLLPIKHSVIGLRLQS